MLVPTHIYHLTSIRSSLIYISRTQGGSANCDEDVVKKRSENSTAPKYFIDSNAMSNFERDRLGHRGPGDEISTGLVKGLDHIRNPQLNKVIYIYII